MPFDDMFGESPVNDEDEATGVRTARLLRGCGGYASYTGHCGATDCPDCYPTSYLDEYDSEE